MQQTATPPLEAGDAPPKQVAKALERLGEAGRMIADVRLGADLEALFFVASEPHHQQSSRCLNLIFKEESLMRQHLKNLRSIGRLALKTFTDQKRRFFRHLDDDSGVEYSAKKLCSPLPLNPQEELGDQRVSDISSHLEKEIPDFKTFTYQRLDWLKRASALPSAANESSIALCCELSKDHGFLSTTQLRQESASIQTTDEAAVIELLLPSVFRAVIPLHQLVPSIRMQ